MTQKTRSLVSLLALMGLCSGAGLFAYYGIYQKQEQEQTEKEKKELLFPDLSKSEITHLTITAKGQTTVLSQNDSQKWQIVSPLTTLADQTITDSLIERLLSLKSKSLVEEKAVDLAPYGLVQPKIKIVARAKTGKELVFRAGEENGFDNSFYVALADSSDVLQVEGGFQHALEKSLFDLRDKQIFPLGESEPKAIEINIANKTYSLKKLGEQWELTAPVIDRADPPAVNRIVMALRDLKASQYVTDSASSAEFTKYGLDSPRIKITSVLSDNTKMNLSINQIEENGTKKSYARRQELPFIAEVPASILSDLDINLDDIRDKTILSFKKDKVFKAVFDFGTDSITLEQDSGANHADSKWKIVAPRAGPASTEKMNSILWTLSTLKGSRLINESNSDLVKYGLDHPKKIALFDSSGKELGTVLLGKETDSHLFAKNSSSPRTYEIAKNSVSNLPTSRSDLEESAPSKATR